MLSNTQRRRIEWGHCDPAGIVFNPHFFAFFDHGTALLFEAAGWPKLVMIKTFGLVGIPLVDTRAKFLSPCAFGDDVDITSIVADVRRSSFDVRHELRKGDQLCVEGFETRVWAGRDDAGRMKSVPIPDEIKVRLLAE